MLPKKEACNKMLHIANWGQKIKNDAVGRHKRNLLSQNLAQISWRKLKMYICEISFKHSKILNGSESYLHWQGGNNSMGHVTGGVQWSECVAERRGHRSPQVAQPELQSRGAEGIPGTDLSSCTSPPIHTTWDSLLSDSFVGRKNSTLLRVSDGGEALELNYQETDY